MDKLSIIQRTPIVQLYFESNCYIVRTQRAFRRNTRDRNHPSPRCIRLIVAKEQHKTRYSCHQSRDVTFRDDQCSCKNSSVCCCRRATPERYYLPQLVDTNLMIQSFRRMYIELYDLYKDMRVELIHVSLLGGG